jgi:hypothetical protein
MRYFLRKKKKYNLDPSLILEIEIAKNQYDFIKELIEIIQSDFKFRNLEIPTLFLKEFVIKLESSLGFSNKFINFYDVISLLC